MAVILVLNYRLEQHTRTVYRYLAREGHTILHCPLMDAIDDSEYELMPAKFISKRSKNLRPFIGESSVVREQVFFTTDLSAAWELFRRRKEVEVVIIHGMFFLPTPILVMLAQLLGKRVIGQVFLRPVKYELKRSKIIHFIRKLYFSRLDKVLAAGDLRILDRYGVPGSRIQRFSPFIDFGNEKPSAEDAQGGAAFRRPGRPTIGFVGQLFHLKGLEELLHAYIILKQEFAELSLVLIGGSPPESGAASCEALLRSMIKEKSLADVEITGWISRADVKAKLRSLDVFVFPSRGDTYPKAVMEAMAIGIPVALSDACGSVGNLAEHEVSCVVFEARNIAAIVHETRRLLVDFDLRLRVAAEAKARIAKSTPEAVCEVYSEALGSIMRETGLV